MINTQKPPRQFLPEQLEINSWDSLKPFYESLLAREIGTPQDLEKWLADASELDSIVSEDYAWRYIRMTCDTGHEENAGRYKYFVTDIQPKIAPESNLIDQKLLASPLFNQLEGNAYTIMRKRLQKDVELFREENIAIQSAIDTERQQYGAISGAMSVNIEGKEVTLQQAGVWLESPDRAKREEVYRKINDRRRQDAPALDALFSSLVQKRNQIAVNAGFANFRDYSFKSMGRFDYTPADCFDFHESVAEALMPVVNMLAEKRKKDLGYSEIRPWDYTVDVSGKPALKAFNDANELIEKSIECFHRLDPFLGECLATLKDMGRLDLESRKGKAPGGYNYPLMETGIPFVFMNATSTVRDLVTLMHEGGHAVHAILIKDLSLQSFRHLTPEIAELASMSMELMSMDHWDLFFENPDDLKRAKAKHVEGILEVLPWIALIDAFQHWIYENPQHSIEERTQEWNKLFARFSPSATDWSGLEQYRDILWHRQLHLFELPFYYIEYGIAQLGAIAIWRNYRKNPKQALGQYMDALSLGYTQPIPAIYETAGVSFNFSKGYIEGLMQFVQEELEAIMA